MRRLLVGFLATAATLLVAQPCWACSCAVVPPREHAAAADAVFTGRVIDVDAASAEARLLRVTIVTETVYKGNVGPRIAIETEMDSAACGFPMERGARYTIFASLQPDGDLETNLCSGSQDGAIEPSAYGLGSGTPPTGPVEAPLVPSPELTWPIALTAGAVLVGTLIAVLALRRRRRLS